MSSRMQRELTGTNKSGTRTVKTSRLDKFNQTEHSEIMRKAVAMRSPAGGYTPVLNQNKDIDHVKP